MTTSDLHVINPYSLSVKSFEDLSHQQVYKHLNDLSKINVNLHAVVVLRSNDILLFNALARKDIFSKCKGVKLYTSYQDKESFDIEFYKPLIRKRWIDPAESIAAKAKTAQPSKA